MKTANKIVTIIAGLLLVIASALKAYQLLTEPVVSPAPWESRGFFVVVTPLEMGLGIWLLSGLFRKAGWAAAIAAYSIFMASTLYRAIIGSESCGCFGPIDVDPWITFFTVNVTILLGLLIFRPKDTKLLPPPWPSAAHFFGVAIPTFIFLPALVLVLIFNRPPDIGDGFVVVKPDKWQLTQPQEPARDKQPAERPSPQPQEPNDKTTDAADKQQSEKTQTEEDQEAGQEFPMLRYIDIADSLRKGIVVIVFWRHDCPDCHEAAAMYDNFSREMAGNEGAIRLAFIEVPPLGQANETIVPQDTLSLTGRLDSTIQWFNITTPFVAVITDGSLIKYWQGRAPSPDEILNAVFADGI